MPEGKCAWFLYTQDLKNNDNADDRALQSLFMSAVQSIPEVILIIWLEASAVPNLPGRPDY